MSVELLVFCSFLRIIGRMGICSTTACVVFVQRAAQSGAYVDGLLGSELQSEAASTTTSQIIFLGTGTSEGIPRVSCLTNPEKSCPVSLVGFLCFPSKFLCRGLG